MADGALTLRNNTGSQYYLIYSGGAFSANRNAGEELSLYDAEGKKLTALPEGAFQAYICSADGSKLLSDTIAAEDAQKTITADYVVTGDLSLDKLQEIIGSRSYLSGLPTDDPRNTAVSFLLPPQKAEKKRRP